MRKPCGKPRRSSANHCFPGRTDPGRTHPSLEWRDRQDRRVGALDITRTYNRPILNNMTCDPRTRIDHSSGFFDCILRISIMRFYKSQFSWMTICSTDKQFFTQLAIHIGHRIKPLTLSIRLIIHPQVLSGLRSLLKPAPKDRKIPPGVPLVRPLMGVGEWTAPRTKAREGARQVGRDLSTLPVRVWHTT